jgi:hypothetical protein
MSDPEVDEQESRQVLKKDYSIMPNRSHTAPMNTLPYALVNHAVFATKKDNPVMTRFHARREETACEALIPSR